MDVSLQLDFIHKLNFQSMIRHSKGYNFKHFCPSGLDRKRRGYILIDHEKVTVYCFHCGLNVSLRTYIEINDPELFQEWQKLEKEEWLKSLKAGTISKKKSLPESKITPIEDIKIFKLWDKYFIPARESKEALEYCHYRKIPEHIIDGLKYNINPNAFYGGHLVFPCYYKGDYVYAFQTRSIKQKIFYTHSKNESFKVYNYFNVDFDKPVFIFESIIDSLYVPNSIAALGTSISESVLQKIKYPVYCFDNDLTKDRKGLMESIKKAQEGYNVFVWPTELKWAKDTNDLAVKGWTSEQIERMVKCNIKKGLGAVTLLKLRTRGKK